MNSFIGQVLSVNNDYIGFVKNFGAFKRTYPVNKIFSADLIYRPGNKSIVLNNQSDLYIILEDGVHLAICEIKGIKKVK